MIQRLTHTVVWVTDQNGAYDFYVKKLGFDVRTDNDMGGFRWLTVGPKGQPDVEMVLMPLMPGPMMDAETVAALRKVVEKGALGAGMFETPDCHKTYEELKAVGVEFMQPPAERFYGIEALFKDNSGNWLSIIERK